MKKSSIFNKLLYFINSVFACILLFAYLLPYISPETIPAFAVFSLFVPLLIIINTIFLIYWIIKLKKHVLISAFVLGIGWFFATPFYKFTQTKSAFNSDIKIMSYNVRMFNFYNWSDDEQTSMNMFDFIREKNPDILAIQEYYGYEGVQIDFPYKYIKTKSKTNKFGLAIYSKFKIIKTGSLDYKNTANNAIYVDVLKEKDTVRIYNIHLESLKINPEKENFGQENSEKLFKRLKNGFLKQTTQTEQFLAHEKQWKGKKIICGDFNNTSYSWVYTQISRDKKDAFIEAGKGFGKSFNYMFPMRIDFILTDESMLVNNFETFSVKYSDHFPIQARINW
jgi:endonuclease/exonuclease/phosphatase family metal-dependent hydrolase